MLLEILFFICLFVYLISITEIIGSYIITKNEHGSSSDVKLILGFFCPPFAPFVALAIYSSAMDLYLAHKENYYQIDESFYGYVIHGFKSINAWSFKKGKK